MHGSARLTIARSIRAVDWAMLKPRYPLSECDVPQPPSGSTPSSASSPYASTRSGLPSHEPTPPGGSHANSLGKKKKRFELDFVHLDPVLSVHMRMQSMSMLGRGVIEFIHPEERERESYKNRMEPGGVSLRSRRLIDRGTERSVFVDPRQQSGGKRDKVGFPLRTVQRDAG